MDTVGEELAAESGTDEVSGGNKSSYSDEEDGAKLNADVRAVG